MKIQDKIETAHVIYCDYCCKPEILTTSFGADKAQMAENLVNCGWTINEHGAVKCGPCKWKEDKST